jgi:hypothetical protein
MTEQTNRCFGGTGKKNQNRGIRFYSSCYLFFREAGNLKAENVSGISPAPLLSQETERERFTKSFLVFAMLAVSVRQTPTKTRQIEIESCCLFAIQGTATSAAHERTWTFLAVRDLTGQHPWIEFNGELHPPVEIVWRHRSGRLKKEIVAAVLRSGIPTSRLYRIAKELLRREPDCPQELYDLIGLGCRSLAFPETERKPSRRRNQL